MSVSHDSVEKRKSSGGRRRRAHDKKKYDMGSLPTNPQIGEAERKNSRRAGGNIKTRVKYAEMANVFDPATKKWQQVKMKTEKENPANRNYARMNIITKGAIVDTDVGPIRITSRPGQHGTVNAVLLEKKA
jgi:small subunit ribosomal protein S8e